MNWNEYFAMMEDWKQLPAYRAEPRIDSLIGFYLPDMAMTADFCNEKIIGIVPELPIRFGTVKPDLNEEVYADKSYKVDFYLLGASGKNYFIEFKTDSDSRRDKQDTYLDEARRVGMEAVSARGGIRLLGSGKPVVTVLCHVDISRKCTRLRPVVALFLPPQTPSSRTPAHRPARLRKRCCGSSRNRRSEPVPRHTGSEYRRCPV